MEPLTKTQALDRHALVLAVWLTSGLIAATLFRFGLGAGGALYIIAAFVVILAAFAGHVIVNAVFRTTFTPRELGTGLVIYAAALLSLGLTALLSPDFRAGYFIPVSIGFIVVLATVVFYMVTHFGVRRSFEAFDVIRDFKS